MAQSDMKYGMNAKAIFLFFLLFFHPIHCEQTMEMLKQAGWDKWVGGKVGIWVSVSEQKLTVFDNYEPVYRTSCSTGANGTGSRVNSYQTPLGWHIVRDKIGEGMPWGAVFESREFTGKIWSKSQVATGDLILTRILRLQGMEPGLNQGEGIDSYDRYIYIHGTPEESKLGSPASHGCVRLSNNAIIQLFNITPLYTPVLITE